MLRDTYITFIGSGIMGEAIIKGLLDKGLTEPASITATDISEQRLALLHQSYDIHTTTNNALAVQKANIVVMSIKPQTLPEVAKEMNGQLLPDALVLSIMAGVRISTMRNAFGHGCIVRAMPNTPAQIGMGVTVWMGTPQVHDRQLAQAEAILGAMGEQVHVHNEDYLDMATGLSGSGPGFIFLLLEAMIDAGVHMGFTRDDARRIVLQTVEGSAALMRSTGLHPAELRNRVTSPGGTTAAGLYEMEKDAIRSSISRAIFAAYRRSQELGALSEQK
jgi:pyrroline-5-carboxylate reductase